jgi:hypothetical protein
MLDLQPALTGTHIALRPLAAQDFPLVWAQHPDPGRGTQEGFPPSFDGALKSKGCLVAIDAARWKNSALSSREPRTHRGGDRYMGCRAEAHLSLVRHAHLVMRAEKSIAHRFDLAQRRPALLLKALREGGHAFIVVGQQALLGGFVEE